MKAIVNLLAVSAVMGVGMTAGVWIWDNVLEDKANKVVENLAKKKLAKEGA